MSNKHMKKRFHIAVKQMQIKTILNLFFIPVNGFMEKKNIATKLPEEVRGGCKWNIKRSY